MVSWSGWRVVAVIAAYEGVVLGQETEIAVSPYNPESFIESLDFPVFINAPYVSQGLKSGVWAGCYESGVRLAKTLHMDSELVIVPGATAGGDDGILGGIIGGIGVKASVDGVDGVGLKADSADSAGSGGPAAAHREWLKVAKEMFPEVSHGEVAKMAAEVLGEDVVKRLGLDEAMIARALDSGIDRLYEETADILLENNDKEFINYATRTFQTRLASIKEKRAITTGRGSNRSPIPGKYAPNVGYNTHIEMWSSRLNAVQETFDHLINESPYSKQLTLILSAITDAQSMTPTTPDQTVEDVAAKLAAERLAQAADEEAADEAAAAAEANLDEAGEPAAKRGLGAMEFFEAFADEDSAESSTSTEAPTTTTDAPTTTTDAPTTTTEASTEAPTEAPTEGPATTTEESTSTSSTSSWTTESTTPTLAPLPEMKVNMLNGLSPRMVLWLTGGAMGHLLRGIAGPIGTSNSIGTPATGGLGPQISEAVDISAKMDYYDKESTCAMITMLTADNCEPQVPIEPKCPTEETYDFEAYSDPMLCDKFATLPEEGVPVPLVLQPLEATGSNAENGYEMTKEAFLRDGGVFYYVFRAIARWTSAVDLELCRLAYPKALELVPGWKTVAQFWAAEEGNHEQINDLTLPAFPLTTVLEGEKCDFLLVNRGTGSVWEAGADFDIITTPMHMDRYTDLEITAHRGAYRLFNGMWPAFNMWMAENVMPRCNRVKFFLAGHSLGGGLTEVWTVKMQDRYGDYLEEPVSVLIGAPMHGINQEGTDFLLQQKVNLRSVIYQGDVIPYLPLANKEGFHLCDERTSLGVPGQGRIPGYPQHLHRFTMVSKDMEEVSPHSAYQFTARALAKISTSMASGKPGWMLIGPNHWCTYTCLATSLCTSNEALWDECEMAYGTEDQAPCNGAKQDLDFPNLSCHDYISKSRCYA